jgi:hypothetical protein
MGAQAEGDVDRNEQVFFLEVGDKTFPVTGHKKTSDGSQCEIQITYQTATAFKGIKNLTGQQAQLAEEVGTSNAIIYIVSIREIIEDRGAMSADIPTSFVLADIITDATAG